jgi:hypothetical protein
MRRHARARSVNTGANHACGHQSVNEARIAFRKSAENERASINRCLDANVSSCPTRAVAMSESATDGSAVPDTRRRCTPRSAPGATTSRSRISCWQKVQGLSEPRLLTRLVRLACEVHPREIPPGRRSQRHRRGGLAINLRPRLRTSTLKTFRVPHQIAALMQMNLAHRALVLELELIGRLVLRNGLIARGAGGPRYPRDQNGAR